MNAPRVRRVRPRNPDASFPHLREHRVVDQALAAEAAKAGVHRPEVVRRALAAYVARPWKLSTHRVRDGKAAVWGAFWAHPDLVAAFTRHATDQGVLVSEAIRQVVRRHLARRGYAMPPAGKPPRRGR